MRNHHIYSWFWSKSIKSSKESCKYNISTFLVIRSVSLEPCCPSTRFFSYLICLIVWFWLIIEQVIIKLLVACIAMHIREPATPADPTTITRASLMNDQAEWWRVFLCPGNKMKSSGLRKEAAISLEAPSNHVHTHRELHDVLRCTLFVPQLLRKLHLPAGVRYSLPCTLPYGAMGRLSKYGSWCHLFPTLLCVHNFDICTPFCFRLFVCSLLLLLLVHSEVCYDWM